MDDATTRDDAPPHVRELAEQCIRLVHAATGVRLAYDSETLPVLDHYLRTAPKDDVLLAALAGAYFGEVVRRGFPCRWSAPVGDFGAWRIEFEHVFLHFSPIAFAHEAAASTDVVEGGAGFGVLDRDVATVRAGLDALGTISEDDYFRLATRYEVLSTVVDRLTGEALAQAAGVTVYEAAAYAMALDDAGSVKPS